MKFYNPDEKSLVPIAIPRNPVDGSQIPGYIEVELSNGNLSEVSGDRTWDWPPVSDEFIERWEEFGEIALGKTYASKFIEASNLSLVASNQWGVVKELVTLENGRTTIENAGGVLAGVTPWLYFLGTLQALKGAMSAAGITLTASEITDIDTDVETYLNQSFVGWGSL